MNSEKLIDYGKRWALLALGMFVTASGISLITQTHLGTTPISSLPYTITGLTGLTFGTTTFIVNVVFFVIEWLLLKKRGVFHAFMCFQVPVVFVFSAFIDFTMTPAAAVMPSGYIPRFIVSFLGNAILALGIVMQIHSRTIVQPGEGMFRALFPGMWRKQEQANIEKAEALLERFLLIKKKDDYAGALSGGQRKLLEMARALMSDPKLVMLDEPMAGVNPALKQSLLDHIMALREEGTTVLFVEHDINMVRHIADWVTVMAEGKIVAEGQPKSVMNDPAVIDAYLGAHANVDLGDDSVLEDLKEA